jgi:hypothetical protein
LIRYIPSSGERWCAGVHLRGGLSEKAIAFERKMELRTTRMPGDHQIRKHLNDERLERERLFKISEQFLLKSKPPAPFKQFQAWLKIMNT